MPIPQPWSILVVDDSEPFRRVLFSILAQRAEYQVIGHASDGLEALQKAEELQPDLILLDIGLPKLNGLKAARQIRQVVPRARLLFMSVEFSFELVEAALGCGGVGYVHKLRAGRDLLHAFEAVLNGRYFVSGVVPEDLGQTARDRVRIRHEVQWCSDDAVFQERVTDAIAAFLSAGQAAILVATEPHRAGVLQGLRGQGIDVGDAVARGVLSSIDVAETITSDMHDPTTLFNAARSLIEPAAAVATSTQHPRVAICRECPSLLLAEGRLADVLQLERQWDLIGQTFTVDMWCGYLLALLERHKDILQRISAEHSAVYSR